jgi:hypothetical protein
MSSKNTATVRYHSSDYMDGLREFAGVTEPVAVVIRPGGSVDVYGCVAIIDQRPATSTECLRCGAGAGYDCVVPGCTGRTPQGKAGA